MHVAPGEMHVDPLVCTSRVEGAIEVPVPLGVTQVGLAPRESPLLVAPYLYPYPLMGLITPWPCKGAKAAGLPGVGHKTPLV